MLISDKNSTLMAISDIDSAIDVSDVVTALASHVGRYGFTTVSVCQLVNPAMVGHNRLMVTNWPKALVSKRMQRSHFSRDPVVRYALKTKKPFAWREAYQHADRYGKQIMDEARAFDQNVGFMFPIHTFDSIPGGVSLGAEALDLAPDEIRMLDLICLHAYTRLSSLLGPFPYEIEVKLTNREVDVIHYAAAGKTNWEISSILGISENTVPTYLKSAARKLGARGRTQTVALAMARNHVLM